MRSGWLLAAGLAGAIGAAGAAGCYQPTLHEGAPCGEGATCPSGQECRAGTCFFTSTPADANLFGDAIELDSSMITVDAPPDGPPYIAWGTPVELTTLELAEDAEDDPSVTTNKLTIVLSAKIVAAPNDRDLYIGTRSAMTDSFVVTPLTVLNATPSGETSGEISADGSTLYFVSDRVTAGDGDVYVSTQTGGVWAAPTLVPQLSVGNVNDIAISPDGLTAVIVHGAFYVHTRASTTAAWSAGVAHSELTTGLASATAPTITNGAQTIYFHAGATRDVYTSHRNANGTFPTATPVAELNTTASRDAAPFVSQTDNYMIFERDYDIFETTR
ncbi:MAG TPA: hypothetical protein VMZ53_02990 [Kofleriaceae bacterium]|nr:hypothetical protein [Kofleriaceae bacterium]